MSKWALLKSSLGGKRDNESAASIHRFDGFQMLSKKKKLWPGYHFQHSMSLDAADGSDFGPVAIALAGHCEGYFQVSDSAEIRVTVAFTGAQALVEDFTANVLHCQKHGDMEFECEDTLTHDTTATGIIHTQRLWVKSATFEPAMKRSAFWSYTLPDELCTKETGPASANVLYTREKPATEGVGLNGLLSNRLHGIDNTGNVCVWASESVLLYTLLHSPMARSSLHGARVLELGGGMTALSGLGVAVMAPCREVVLTDGHPDCVANQKVCLQMTRQSLSPSSAAAREGRADRVRCAQLRWSIGDEHGDLAALTMGNTAQLFDVILVADCLFFKACHDALVWTLRHSLAPRGTVYLLQPRRGVTMALFMEKATLWFDMTVQEEYCERVSDMRSGYQDKDKEQQQQEGGNDDPQYPHPGGNKNPTSASRYDEDIHYPVLLSLRWKAREGGDQLPV